MRKYEKRFTSRRWLSMCFRFTARGSSRAVSIMSSSYLPKQRRRRGKVGEFVHVCVCATDEIFTFPNPPTPNFLKKTPRCPRHHEKHKILISILETKLKKKSRLWRRSKNGAFFSFWLNSTLSTAGPQRRLQYVQVHRYRVVGETAQRQPFLDCFFFFFYEKQRKTNDAKHMTQNFFGPFCRIKRSKQTIQWPSFFSTIHRQRSRSPRKCTRVATYHPIFRSLAIVNGAIPSCGSANALICPLLRLLLLRPFRVSFSKYGTDIPRSTVRTYLALSPFRSSVCPSNRRKNGMPFPCPSQPRNVSSLNTTHVTLSLLPPWSWSSVEWNVRLLKTVVEGRVGSAPELAFAGRHFYGKHNHTQ